MPIWRRFVVGWVLVGFACQGTIGQSVRDPGADAGDERRVDGGDPASDSATVGDSGTAGFTCDDYRTLHPDWLLCDGFEAGNGSYDSWVLATDFLNISGGDDRGRVDIASDVVHSGNHSLHMPAAEDSDHRGGSLDWFACDGAHGRGCDLAGFDQLYMRAWVRFAADHVFVHHFLTMGGSYTSSSFYNTAEAGYGSSYSGYWFSGTAGCRPHGDTHLGMTVETDRSTDPSRHGTAYFYSYHPGITGSACDDRFDGICTDCNRWDQPDYEWRLQIPPMEPTCSSSPELCYWGESFKPTDAEIAADASRYTFPKGEWFCIELMMRANTPNAANGEMAYWINGNLGKRVSGMMWRTTDTLAMNQASVQHYIGGQYWFGTPVQSNRVWFDDVVISTQPVGCQ